MGKITMPGGPIGPILPPGTPSIIVLPDIKKAKREYVKVKVTITNRSSWNYSYGEVWIRIESIDSGIYFVKESPPKMIYNIDSRKQVSTTIEIKDKGILPGRKYRITAYLSLQDEIYKGTAEFYIKGEKCSDADFRSYETKKIDVTTFVNDVRKSLGLEPVEKAILEIYLNSARITKEHVPRGIDKYKMWKEQRKTIIQKTCPYDKKIYNVEYRVNLVEYTKSDRGILDENDDTSETNNTGKSNNKNKEKSIFNVLSNKNTMLIMIFLIIIVLFVLSIKR